MEDSIYRLRPRDVLALCVLSLLALGAIMVQSAGTEITGTTAFVIGKTGTRHLMYVALSVGIFFLVGHLDYHLLARWPRFGRPEGNQEGQPSPASAAIVRDRPAGHGASEISLSRTGSTRLLAPPRQWFTPVMFLYALGVLCCLLALVPGIGKEINGARRWLQLGPIQLQASEAGKWACVLLFAWILAALPVNLSRFRGFVVAMFPLGILCLLVVKEDFGTAALIGFCCITMMMVGGARLWHLGIALPPVLAVGYWFVRHSPNDYRWKRLISFIDPFADPKHGGYHLIQSLLSFATGGITGRGLGNGIQKLGYLPEDTTDFIFSTICEELGLFGALLTIALYLGILWAAWQIVRQAKDELGRILAFGVGAMIGFQAMINIAVATVSVPPKGLPLPLVSFGGSGLIITSAALGLVYSIARHGERQNNVLPLRTPADLADAHAA